MIEEHVLRLPHKIWWGRKIFRAQVCGTTTQKSHDRTPPYRKFLVGSTASVPNISASQKANIDNKNTAQEEATIPRYHFLIVLFIDQRPTLQNPLTSLVDELLIYEQVSTGSLNQVATNANYRPLCSHLIVKGLVQRGKLLRDIPFLSWNSLSRDGGAPSHKSSAIPDGAGSYNALAGCVQRSSTTIGDGVRMAPAADEVMLLIQHTKAVNKRQTAKQISNNSRENSSMYQTTGRN